MSGEPNKLVYDTQRVRRDGELDLEFVGALLASHHHESDDGYRWTEVDLFVTASGKFVSVVRFGGTSRRTIQSDAKVCATPEEVVEWMRGRRGRIGIAGKTVLERANRLYPDVFPFRPIETI